mmetsp:Transcript_10192/g.25199  ORF Transcript_10192/g.25199 Transcript_10192/m.25199 type:complete len:645 (-) Transcript_10192:80-2014(-)
MNGLGLQSLDSDEEDSVSTASPFASARANKNWKGTNEGEACEWIKDVTGVDINPADLQQELRSGVVLCTLANKLRPGAIKKINNSEMPFAQRENIGKFCEFVREAGVKDINNFTPDDLFEAKSIKQVVICILSLGRQAHSLNEYSGPCIGQRDSGLKEAEGGGVGRPSHGPGPGGGAAVPAPRQSTMQRQDSSDKKFKWEVKPGGSFVPQVPAVAQRAAEEKDREQHTHQRKWEVKFAPQLATASRRTIVLTSEAKEYINEITSNNQLRTAMGGGSGSAAHKHDQKNILGGAPGKLTSSQLTPPTESDRRKTSNQAPNAAGRQQGPGGNEGDDDEEYDDEDEEEDEDLATAYRGVPPAGVVEGLMMMLTSPDPTEKAKAAAALCNICSETDSNRELVVQAGGLPSLIDMLVNPSPDVPFMQSAAAACICNLAANLNSKETIATSGALEVLVNVLQSENQAAAAQAAGALWSLCVDNDGNKQRVADVGAIPHLIGLLLAQDSFAQSQSAGALSECSIRNDNNKKLISDHGAIVPLVQMLTSTDLSVQRLSSCALCNVCANHEANRRQAREVGALPVLVNLLSVSQVPEVLSPVAGAICNLAMKCPENKAEFCRLGAANVLRKLVDSPIPSLHGNALAALEQLEMV